MVICGRGIGWRCRFFVWEDKLFGSTPGSVRGACVEGKMGISCCGA